MKKPSPFWKDDNGFTKEDFEKLVTGLLFILSTLAVLYKFVFDDIVRHEITNFTLGIGTLFVVRKAVSYFKRDSYYERCRTDEDKPSEEVKEYKQHI